jgi:hypothetical protein
VGWSSDGEWDASRERSLSRADAFRQGKSSADLSRDLVGFGLENDGGGMDPNQRTQTGARLIEPLPNNLHFACDGLSGLDDKRDTFSAFEG